MGVKDHISVSQHEGARQGRGVINVVRRHRVGGDGRFIGYKEGTNVRNGSVVEMHGGGWKGRGWTVLT